jgi:hypothetical protein
VTIAADIVTTLGATLSNKLYPMVAPAGVAAPYGVYQMVSAVPITHLSGQSNRTNYRFQVDIFARDKIALDALAVSVMAAMDAASLFDSVCLNAAELFEDPAMLFRVTLDFSVWQ